MKKELYILLIMPFLMGCPGMGLRQVEPKSDKAIQGYFLRKSDCQENYYAYSYMWSEKPKDKEKFIHSDTLMLDDHVKNNVFFAKIEEKNLKTNGYQNMTFNSGVPTIMYIKGDFKRVKIPCENNREFMVVERVVGVL